MRVQASSPLIYQAAWLGSELQEMYEGMKLRFQQVSGVMANSAVQESYKKMKGNDVDSSSDKDAEDETKVHARDADDCPICFDSLSQAATTYCRAQCGTIFHQNCIQHWKRQQHGTPTCPICRGSWEESARSGGAQQNEGYTNLGRLQGQSPDRDTSSYNSRWDDSYFFGSKRRRRY